MTDKAREALELRAILVSGRAALRGVATPEERERVNDTITELLARLEDTVIRDGADPQLLSQIEEARSGVWE